MSSSPSLSQLTASQYCLSPEGLAQTNLCTQLKDAVLVVVIVVVIKSVLVVLRLTVGLCCVACHVACATSCTDGTASTCDACSEGWQPDGFGLLRQACKGTVLYCHFYQRCSFFLLRIRCCHLISDALLSVTDELCRLQAL